MFTSEDTSAEEAKTDFLDVDKLEILVVMRFSFFGQSGWKSETANDKELLFSHDRLATRLTLLRSIALASLASQTDKNFHLFVLTSEDLPQWAMEKLKVSCDEILGAGRYSIAPHEPGPARKFLRHFMVSRYKSGQVVQVVLDDDDGFAADFMASLRQELRQFPSEQFAPDARPAFVSFFNGYGLVSRQDAVEPLALYKHRYPFINLGLSMISSTKGVNILAIDHRTAPNRYGCRKVRGVLMWVRSLHAFNDSRVAVSDRWVHVDDWTQYPDIHSRFSYLLDLE